MVEALQKFDFYDIPKIDEKKVDANGFIEFYATPTRCGVFKYQNSDGTIRRELRHPDHVFKSDSMKSLSMIPVTDDHPLEFLSPENVHQYQIGTTGSHADIKAEKEFINCLVKITKKDGISSILSGKNKLSCGYTSVDIKEDGIYNGEEYDLIQTNIKYNHLAIVDDPRGGEFCKLKLDSKGKAFYFIDNFNIKKTMSENVKEKIVVKKELSGKKIGELKFDSITVKDSEENKPLINQRKELLEAIEKMDSEKQAQQAKLDSIEAENKELKEKLEGSIPEDKFDSLIEERSKINQMLNEINLESPKGEEGKKLDAFSTNEQGKILLCKTVGGFNEEKLEKNDSYRSAAFDQVLEKWTEKKDSIHAKQNLEQGLNLPNHLISSNEDFNSKPLN